MVAVRTNACRSSIPSHANGTGLCSGLGLSVRVLHFRVHTRAPPRTKVTRRVVMCIGCPQGAVGMVWRLSSTRRNHIAGDRHLEVLGSRVPDLSRASVLKWLRPLGDHQHLSEMFETHAGPQLPIATALFEEPGRELRDPGATPMDSVAHCEPAACARVSSTGSQLPETETRGSADPTLARGRTRGCHHQEPDGGLAVVGA